MTIATTMDRRATMPVIAHAASNSRKVTALQSFGLRKKSEIDIILDGKDDFIPTYSTFDEIKGHANIRFEKDTLVDGLNIVFQGQSDTWVEKMATASPRSGRATAKHIFLRMQQPIDGNPFSQDNIAKAGETYSIPFKFVVPESMLPFVCNHTAANSEVKSQHLLLPPSMGDEMLSGEGSVLMDDLCPAMAKIVYSIRVALVKSSLNDRPRDVVQDAIRVRITPSRSELPPVIIPECGDDRCQKYHLRKEKNVRKGIFKLGKKSGRLIAETNQPRSLRLPHVRQTNKAPSSTSTTINLRYDPASADEAPPQLSSVESKLKAYTFFGAQSFKQLPDPTNYDVWSIMHSQYAVMVGLSNMNLSSVKWEKHQPQSTDTQRIRQGSVATSTSSASQAVRTMSTSTGAEFTSQRPKSRGFDRPLSRISNSSNDSYSGASSTTSLSSSASPTMVMNNQVFPGPTVIAPSTTYDQNLPYYTTSIVVPITLPSIHKSVDVASPNQNTLSNARRNSVASTENSYSTHTSNPTISHPVPNAFGRKRGTPTFVPTFHSCLISRIYALDLTVHASNPAPQINLRVPIQISSEYEPAISGSRSPTTTTRTQRPTLSAPLAWYDPSDIAELDLNSEPNRDTKTALGQEEDDRDTANDEAIAQALSAQYTQQTHRFGFDDENNNDEGIPSYAEIQTNTDNTLPSPFQQQQPRRHNSLPFTSSFAPYNHAISTNERLINTNDNDDEQPPEYGATAGFRRQSQVGPSSTMTNTATAAQTQTSPNNTSAQGSRRKSSSGWGKKLRLRN